MIYYRLYYNWDSMSEKKYDYYKPSLPRNLEERIRTLIKNQPELGYRSVVDFILEAIREKIAKLEKD